MTILRFEKKSFSGLFLILRNKKPPVEVVIEVSYFFAVFFADPELVERVAAGFFVAGFLADALALP